MRYAKIKLSKLPEGVGRRRLVSKDGYTLLNEKDVCGIAPGSFEEIVSTLGGDILSHHEAKVELKKNNYSWQPK